MTDRQMLDILSTFSQATDESKPLTEGKRTVTADTAMADILGKLQQLNESAQPVTEGKMKELLGDIDELTSDEFSDKYSMSKAEAKAKFNFGDEEVNEGDGIYHDCATKFEHKVYGECTVLPGEHTLLEDGTVTHYDATFIKEGKTRIVRNVAVKNMHNVVSEGHTHASKSTRDKKMKESAIAEGADGKMPSKKHVMDMCKDGKSEKEMLEMHADADKDKLKDLIKTCKEEMKDSKQSAIAEGVARIEEKLLKEFTEFKEGKAFAASGVRADKRGKYNTAPQTFYHVKLEKDNVTKAERILASDGDSESDVKSNAKRDNPGWKVVSVRKLDETAKQKAKPDYLDLDGDGDKKEPMKKAAKDKKAKENK